MAIDNAPVIAQPVLADKVIYEIQLALKANFNWLDAAFGRAQKLTKNIDGKRYVLPNVYCGGLDNKGKNDYIEVTPDAHIGNFCFFEINDPQNIDWNLGQPMGVTTPFALIFWFDLRRIYNSETNRNTETLKNDILTLLNGRSGWHLIGGGRIQITKCFEDAKNIYRGYTIDEIDNQYLMHPYAGFRFEGTIEKGQPCEYESPAIHLFDTSDADALPENLAIGKIAYNANGRFVGTGELTNLQEKTATPTTEQQIIVPDAQHNGLSKVTISGVTHDIDSDIVSGNIKQGINILGVDGTVVELQGQTKNYTINENGTTQIIPDAGKNAIIGGSIVVDVDTQTPYDEGYADGYNDGEVAGEATQKAKLTTINVTQNGTYAREDGYKEVNVDVEPALQDKTVTPTTSQQVITPDSGYYGLDEVTVEAVDASIDPDIVAGNIKQGVNILGVNGTVVELNGQTKNYNINQNGETNIVPDSDKNAIVGGKITVNVQPTLQSKTATPTTQSQTIQPDSGYDGLSQVDINPVTSAIDANIQAENIKKDVVILGVTGTLESGSANPHTGHVDTVGLTALNWTENDIAWLQKIVWWDEEDDAYWAVTEANKTKGALITWSNYSSYKNDVDIRFFPKLNAPEHCYNLFNGWSILIAVPTHGWIFRPNSSSLAMNVFYDCICLCSVGDLEQTTIGNNIQQINNMFFNCRSLFHVGKVSNWNVSTIGSMTSMFRNSGIEEIDGFEEWSLETVNILNMFDGCSRLKEIRIRDNYAFSKISFNGCSSLKFISLLSNEPISALIEGNNKFQSCFCLQRIPVMSNFEFSSYQKNNFMNGCMSLQEITIPAITNQGLVSAIFNSMLSLINIISSGKISASVSFAHSSYLTRESCLVLFNALDADNVGTITLHANAKARLSDADKAIATDKGWTIA